jgi:exonuclease SbcC
MRPVLLDMDGYASFRDQATVDFTDSDYFALVGPTGSGKSTVIDAMTFALYGSVPRWQDRRMVMYALAPTANRGTVRLVFDVEGQRYVVARELRRAKNGGVTIKSGRLERLLDPTAIGTINDLTDVIAADGLVTAAVEKLLGLNFDHFCQCVVLPQGEFAEFLRAKGSDRREILLKLLGAGLYKEIGREANTRAAAAGERVRVLSDQLTGMADATAEAEAIAAQRETSLQELAERVADMMPLLRDATTAVGQAQSRLDQLGIEHQALSAVRVPDGVALLDTAVNDVQLAVQAARDVEAAAQAADGAARAARAAAPDREPLEQARRDHAEQRRVLADIPAATADLAAAVTRLEQAASLVETSGRSVDSARDARDAARTAHASAKDDLDRLTAELRNLSAVTIPAGLTELDERSRSADLALRESTVELADAEQQDVDARTAIQRAPRRAPLEHALRQIAELAQASAAVPPLEESHERAAAEHERAQAELDAATAARVDARAALEALAVTNSAALLRPHLAIGDACPVCEQTVATLPKPKRVPKLAAAEKAVAAAETDVQRARAAESRAAAAVATSAAQLAAATERVSRLQSALAGLPTDAASIQESLSGLDRLDATAQAAGEAVQRARQRLAAAQATVRQVDADAAEIRASLQSTRDPLVPLGAPAVDGGQLLVAWTRLTDWAAGEAKARRQALPAGTATAESAATELRGAESSLDKANNDVAASRQAETVATAANERAKAVLAGLTTRLGELTVALVGAPTEADAQAQLARIDQLTAAVDDADAALRRARTERERADKSARSLDAEARAAWQVLRKARDTLIPFGAPELPDGSVLIGWDTLTFWAREQAAARAVSVLAAEDAVVRATRDRDGLVGLVTDDFAALDVPLHAGDVVSTAPVAAASAVTQARADRGRITERLEQAARLRAELAAAETEQQVAAMLGRLLRSDQFPEWLEAAALDTLVADASVRLAELSNGQFELTHRGGEFFVIDHADADSQRGVRTLSGGETFQASLALALALSTQLSSMAAAGAARLDSIFLDEGFGTLDESTLEIVAGTLENLAQGDRMVGVVTHVAALAERVPVRFVVNRDSRTSSIVRETV